MAWVGHASLGVMFLTCKPTADVYHHQRFYEQALMLIGGSAQLQLLDFSASRFQADTLYMSTFPGGVELLQSP